MIIDWLFDKSCANWIVVNVIHFLHEHPFAEYRKDIPLSLPEGVTVVSLAHLMLELSQRHKMIIFLQVISHSMSGNSFENAKYFRDRLGLICHQMNVLEHYHVGEQQKACGLPRL